MIYKSLMQLLENNRYHLTVSNIGKLTTVANHRSHNDYITIQKCFDRRLGPSAIIGVNSIVIVDNCCLTNKYKYSRNTTD